MVKEWDLCKANTETLETLSVTESSFLWNMEDKFIFSKLTTLQIFIQGEFRVKSYRRSYMNWPDINEKIGRIRRWLELHSFPVLERLEILWTSDLLVCTVTIGGIEGYDRDGPIYDIECQDDYEYVNTDAVAYHYGENWCQIDIDWMSSLKIKELLLAKAIYENVEDKEYPFAIHDAPDFTQEEEDAMFEKIEEY